MTTANRRRKLAHMRCVVRVLALAVVVALALVAFALLQAYDPPPEHPLEVSCQEPAEPLAAGRPFTLVSWNIQFCGSRQLHFFYDGGEAVDVPPDLARSTLEGVVRVLAQAAPDLLAIQEIDRDSARTGHVDQGAAIREGIGLACWVTAPYHRSVFVPHPLPNALGAVDMHLGLYARAPLSGAIRTQLPLLREPWYRRAFNLKRAILTADVPVAGAEQPLALATVHLSAFSYGDGTLARALVKYNALKSHTRLQIGRQIRLPPKEVLDSIANE